MSISKLSLVNGPNGRTTLGAGALLLSVAMMACAPTNSRRVAPGTPPVQVTDTADVNRQVNVNPKVDILFVMDTSESMEAHQQNVKDNVSHFVDAFEANKNLDFHIGVVSIFDSRRYGTVVPKGKFYPLGLLRPLKDPAHPGQAVPGPQFVTRSANYAAILGATLQVGIEPRCDYTPDAAGRRNCIDANGPEFEDSFSPVLAALGPQNQGFYRPDAHLAVIMVTDSNDDSFTTPSALAKSLLDLKGGDSDKLSTYAVLALGKCPRDPDGAPTRIHEFLEITKGRAYNLCDTKFGDQLANAGHVIQEKASKISVPLSTIPEFGTIHVKYGTQEIANDRGTGWILDTATNTIVISGDANLTGPKGTKLSITYNDVDARKLGTAHVEAVKEIMGNYSP